MANSIISIKRYPNRRYYARHLSKYVSLHDIEAMVQAGMTVEIRDSQTGEDLTRPVLTQIIMERHPEKMSLFPAAMLHFILRSNDAMSDLLRDYFRHSLSYLDLLQRRSAAASTLVDPMHWIRGWLDGGAAPSNARPPAAGSESGQLRERVEQLEERLKQLEAHDEPAASDAS